MLIFLFPQPHLRGERAKTRAQQWGHMSLQYAAAMCKVKMIHNYGGGTSIIDHLGNLMNKDS